MIWGTWATLVLDNLCEGNKLFSIKKEKIFWQKIMKSCVESIYENVSESRLLSSLTESRGHKSFLVYNKFFKNYMQTQKFPSSTPIDSHNNTLTFSSPFRHYSRTHHFFASSALPLRISLQGPLILSPFLTTIMLSALSIFRQFGLSSIPV